MSQCSTMRKVSATQSKPRVQRRLLSVALALLFAPLPAYAATPLDSSNWQGPAGARFWRITAPGSYYLNVPEATFMTSAEYGVRIEVGNVELDGAGKGISGTAPPGGTAPGTPNLYGVRVNGGLQISNVRVTNLRVHNKYFGVIFEAVDDGRIDAVTATGNQHGLYYWRTNRTTLQANVSSNNLIAGILCDGNAVDSTANVIVDNSADGNGHSGIWMWDRCVGTTIQANAVRDNAQMGVVLSANASGNTVAFNTAQGNSTGIWVESNNNVVRSNVSEDNTNVGVLVVRASSNTLEGNSVRRNANAGIWLDTATSNVIRRNNVASNALWGIFHASNSGGQTVHDNYFSNANNAGFSASGSNGWNTGLAGGSNNVGGSYSGGNFWATPSRTGFSETATDADQNGIADAAHTLAAGNVDALPLFAKARRTPNDSFDMDFKADLLWRSQGSGQNAIWFMNGVAASGQFITPVADPGWRIVGRESFDGDGKTDILWRHTNGQNALWFMDGATAKASSGFIPAVADPNWKVAAVGDLDGDGNADILWRHATTGQPAIWFMRALEIKWSLSLPALGLGWQIAGVADFDGDGKAEILWRDAASGQNAMWWFDSYRAFGSAFLAPAGSGWSVAGIGDFSGDGRADILWRDSAGQNAIWFQNGTTTTSTAYAPPVATEWSISWVGDTNADNRSDIVWRKADGTTALWLMNGASISSSAYLSNTLGWTLVR